MDMDVMQHAGNLFDSSEEEVVEVEEEDFAIEAADAPETVDYLAVLVLPDCDFFIKAPLVTLGRGPVPQVYRLSQSPDAGSDDLSQPSRKRKRDAPDHLDGVADRFQGGLGGELSQAPLEELDDFTDTDGQRINVYPGANESGELMHPKCISRRHLQIFWVPSRDAWCVKVLGRNGVYLDGHFLGIGEAAQLAPGAKLSVKGLEFGFWDVYPNTEPEVLDSGEDMDVDNDDDGDDEDELEQVEDESTSGDEADDDLDTPVSDDNSEEDGEEEDEDEEEDDDVADAGLVAKAHLPPTKPHPPAAIKAPKRILKLTNTGATASKKGGKKPAAGPSTPTQSKKSSSSSRPVKLVGGKKGSVPPPVESVEDTQTSAPATPLEAKAEANGPPKKRGPGRPPADGVMSKKKRKDEERARKMGLSSVDELPSNKYAKSRKDKDGTADSGDVPKKKRVKAGDDSGDESSDSGTKKKKKTPEPAKPPPNRADYTEDQLQKPEETYAQMLCHILKEAPEPMTLPQIYEIFEKRWPYFLFQPSQGWQSSIRHNLQSTPCLVKAGKEGKGHKWILDPTIPFETKSAKKAQQPRAMPYPSPQHIGNGAASMSGLPTPQGYAYPPAQTAYYPRFPPQLDGTSADGASPANQNGVPASGNTSLSQQGSPSTSRPGMAGQAGLHAQHNANGVHQPGAYQNNRLMAGPALPSGVQPRANVHTATAPRPTPPRHHPQALPPGQQLGPAEVAQRRLRVFEAFRFSFVKTGTDDEIRARYESLTRDATKWLMDNPNTIGYTGPKGDVGTVVLQMQEAWKCHPLNPNRVAKDGSIAPPTPQAQSAPPAQTNISQAPAAKMQAMQSQTQATAVNASSSVKSMQAPQPRTASPSQARSVASGAGLAVRPSQAQAASGAVAGSAVKSSSTSQAQNSASAARPMQASQGQATSATQAHSALPATGQAQKSAPAAQINRAHLQAPASQQFPAQQGAAASQGPSQPAASGPTRQSDSGRAGLTAPTATSTSARGTPTTPQIAATSPVVQPMAPGQSSPVQVAAQSLSAGVPVAGSQAKPSASGAKEAPGQPESKNEDK